MNDRAAHALSSRTAATFVVLESGYLGDRIARLAAEHAELDAGRRRVLRDGDAGFPDALHIHAWRIGASVAAVVLDRRGGVCDRLDMVRATSEAWIEDAFLRGNREPG
jgi:hypothetical protein